MATGRYVHRFDKVLEQVLKDILRLYSFCLFGPGFEQELIQQNVVPARRDGSVTRLTLGQTRFALIQLEALVKKDRNLRDLPARLGRGSLVLLPARLTVEHIDKAVDCGQVLTDFIRWRNQEIVHDQSSAPPAPDKRVVREQLEYLRAFLFACRSEGIYPEVLHLFPVLVPKL